MPEAAGLFAVTQRYLPWYARLPHLSALVLGALLTSYVTYLALISTLDARRFDASRKRYTADVTNVVKEKSQGWARYRVEYRFQPVPGGRVYTQPERANFVVFLQQQEAGRVKAAGKVDIYHDSTDPTRSYLAEGSDTSPVGGWVAISAVLAVVSGTCWVFVVLGVRKRTLRPS